MKSATSAMGIVYEFGYDAYGNNTSVSITNGNTKITSTATYTNNGNVLYCTKDALDKTTYYGYNRDTNVLEWVKYPEDTDATRTEYTYDSMYRLASVTADTDSGYSLTASYAYTDDLLTSITTASTTYNFTYGDFAQRTGISIGTRTLATYDYAQDRNRYLETMTYGNGDTVDYEYDSYGRLVKETFEDGNTVTYTYDNSGALATVTDSETGRKTTFYYDLTDRLVKTVETGTDYNHSIEYTYDDKNNLKYRYDYINGTKYATSYTYDDDNRITYAGSGSVVQSLSYDELGRFVYTYHWGGPIERTYYYNENTTQISGVKVNNSSADVRNLTYTYDDNGNILSVSDGTNTTTYVYDSANQLLRENNQEAGKTWKWTYDDNGNILSKTEYAYTTGTLGTAVDTILYGYGDASWGDLLTAYDGTAITYDGIGNPLSDGTWNYTWKHGRQLASMTDGSTTWNYTYDVNGLRTKRTNGTDTYNYIYTDGKLMQMTKGSDTLNFIYEVSGYPSVVKYNGTVYYYVTNLQGDVIAIVNNSGAEVVGYTYDAWGKLLTTSGTMAATLGTLNPLRYRGYVYDHETGLYYLQSRYYNPELGRFINADEYASTGQGFVGNNMFAYCGNNPVNRIDAYGQAWWHWAVAITVVAVAAVAVVATAGGAAPAVAAVASVASGIPACTTASTVAAGVFIGSSTALAASAYVAATESNSVEEFAAHGESALVSTIVGGTVGGAMAYSTTQTQKVSQCFVAGTLIRAENGFTPIEDIRIGDKVWAWDENSGDIALKQVVETYVNETKELVHVRINGEDIITTPKHPFYSPVKGWTEAAKLRAGDILVTVNGEYVVVEKVQHELIDKPVLVYNFQVEGYHTYYVTETGVLVHNKCSGSYEIEFESGKNYVGKGNEARMKVSAKVHSVLNGDPVVSMSWEYAPDTQTAFVDEYFKMAVRGVNNPNTYNIIWSPGRNMFIKQWR